MNPYKKITFHTLGCKLNFSETSAIAAQFEQKGFARVPPEDSPDVVVINTCSVTENANKKCKNLINKSLKKNPQSYIIVMGCYAQLKPEEIKKIKGVKLVLSANEKFDAFKFFKKHETEQSTVTYTTKINDIKTFQPSFSGNERTRSFLKIQDGCNYFCSFCTIPLARGKSRNDTIENTLKKVNEIAEKGVKEIILTGVNIGDFGQGSKENFFELIKKLETANPKIKRYRISSIEPNLLSKEIIQFVANSKKFMPHFHIPLQSGSDELLKKMRRKYDVKLFSSRVHYIKKLIPNACIGVDIIVGFPGESENYFNTTIELVKHLPLSYFHVFTYSEREKTSALKLPDPIPLKIRKERSLLLRTLSKKKQHYFFQSQLNKKREVLFENKQSNGFIYGFTDNYIKVIIPENKSIKSNSLLKIKLVSISKNQESVKADI